MTTLRAVLLAILAVLCAAAPGLGAGEKIRIGVLALNGVPACLAAWSPTAAYLEKTIPGHTFEIVPMLFPEVDRIVGSKQVDFIIANPEIFAGLDRKYGASSLAAMRVLLGGKDISLFGGVIFRRADRTDLPSISSLKGKRLLATEINSFGGFTTQREMFAALGIDPFKDFASLIFTGSHQEVVLRVLAGEADAGACRTGTLEKLIGQGKISPDQVHVFPAPSPDPRAASFPGYLSTKLYPEWPLARMPWVSDELARQVVSRLFDLKPTDPAAVAAGIQGWTFDPSYGAVRDLLISLGLPPYEDVRQVTLAEAARQHLTVVLSGAGAVFVLGALLVGIIMANRRLAAARWAMQAAAEARERAVKELARSEMELRQIFNASAGGMRVVDPAFRTIKVNDAFMDLTGLSREQLEGAPCHELFGGPGCNSNDECALKLVLGGSPRVEYDLEKHRADGVKIICHLIAVPFRSPDGELLGVIEDFRDVTRARQAEEALRRAEEKYRAIFEKAPLGIFQSLPTGRYLSANPQLAAMYGFVSPEEITSEVTNIEKEIYLDPGERQWLLGQFAAGAQTVDFESRRRRRDGSVFWARVTISARRGQEGNILNFDGFVSDISARKQAELTREASERRLGAIFENSPLGLVYFDGLGTIADCNEPAARIMGTPRAALLGMPSRNLVGPFRQALATAQGGTPAVFDGQLVNSTQGKQLFVHAIFNPVRPGESPTEVIASFEDVTLAREKEAELRRLWNVIEKCPISIVITDAAATILYVNPFFSEVTGYSFAEAVGQNPRILKSGVHAPEFYQEMWDVLTSGRTWRGEFCNRKKDGGLYWEGVTISPVTDETGKITHYIAAKEDISERKIQDSELKSALSELEVIFNTSAVGMMLLTGEGTFSRVNDRLLTLFHCQASDLAGRGMRDLHVSPEAAREFEIRWAPFLLRGEVVHVEIQMRRLSGKMFWCALFGRAVSPPDLSAGVIWAVEDVTPRKELETLREDVERIMRHDLKSPLNAIINLPGMIAEEGNLSEEQQEFLGDIREAGERILHQVNMSLDLFKMENGTFLYTPVRVDMGETVSHALRDMSSLIKASKVAVITRVRGLDPSLTRAVMAQGDTQLCYAIVANLIKNAVEASPAGAVVEVAIDEDGGLARVSVHNAQPVPSHLIPVFFEKFATSGKIGGTGLGTYSAKLFAEAQGGRVSLETSKEQGTRVSVELPLYS